MHCIAKKTAVLFVTVAMTLGGLAGCGLFAPHSAQDVLMRYADRADRGNYVADGKLEMVFGVLGQELSLNMDVDAEVRDEALHATTASTIFGANVGAEYYLQKDGDDSVLYSSAGEGDDAVWTKSMLGDKSKEDGGSEGDSTGNGDITSALDGLLFAQKVLEKTAFAETDEGYELTVPGTALLDAIDSSEDAKKLVKDVDQQTLKDVLEDATIVLDFNKDCKLTHLALSVAMDSAQNTFDLDMSCKVSSDFTISGYGSVDEAAVTVPDAVKKNAVDLDDLAGDVGGLFDFSNLMGTEAQKAA